MKRTALLVNLSLFNIVWLTTFLFLYSYVNVNVFVVYLINNMNNHTKHEAFYDNNDPTEF